MFCASLIVPELRKQLIANTIDGSGVIYSVRPGKEGKFPSLTKQDEFVQISWLPLLRLTMAGSTQTLHYLPHCTWLTTVDAANILRLFRAQSNLGAIEKLSNVRHTVGGRDFRTAQWAQLLLAHSTRSRFQFCSSV